MAYAVDDPRRNLPAEQAGGGTSSWVPRNPRIHEMTKFEPAQISSGGSSHHYVRGQNFVVDHVVLVGGERLVESGIPDEHLLLITDEQEVGIRGDEFDEVLASGPALVIVPAGDSVVRSESQTTLVRVFTSRTDELTRRAANADAYAEPDPAVTRLPARPASPGPGNVRVYELADIPDEPGRLGRIFRTDSLMVNWFAPFNGPRDTTKLSPHVHQSFEQCSVTLAGDFIYDFRAPWTPRFDAWRDDEHVLATSPAITIIPPGVVHTSRWIGEGNHQMIDIFAPPRADFAAQNWVLNAGEYASNPVADA